jgi:steroid 5-alpha reductase family enzyme
MNCAVATLCWTHLAVYLTALLGVSLTLNGLLFLIAYHYHTDKLTDISYALTFITLMSIGLSRSSHHSLQWAIAGLVCIWAFRLGGFLLVRIWHAGKDARFDGIRENFWSFGKFWLAQGLSVWVISIAALLGMQSLHTTWSGWGYVGVVIWVIGLILETVADLQKYHFSLEPKNKGQWICSGIWAWSRHPNYFGEMLIWVGIYLFVLPILPLAAVLIALVSPLYIVLLLLFVSGLPPLERAADTRWGSDPAYRQYKRHTSALIPWPPKGAKE